MITMHEAMLDVRKISASYGEVTVLWDISLEAREAEITAIIGPNGAGKSTLLKTIAGLLRPKYGEITFMGRRIDKLSPHEILRSGITLVPEGKELFPAMTVIENLLMGAYTISEKAEIEEGLKRVFKLFPVLKDRSGQLAGTLSGGEQQMLAIARGLMSKPKLLMVDESSLGLAPKLALRNFDVIQELNKERVAILLVEQYVHAALKLADQAYVLEEGKIVMSGKGEELLNDKRLKEKYLGG